MFPLYFILEVLCNFDLRIIDMLCPIIYFNTMPMNLFDVAIRIQQVRTSFSEKFWLLKIKIARDLLVLLTKLQQRSKSSLPELMAP
jgi:hypothetical protein